MGKGKTVKSKQCCAKKKWETDPPKGNNIRTSIFLKQLDERYVENPQIILNPIIISTVESSSKLNTTPENNKEDIKTIVVSKCDHHDDKNSQNFKKCQKCEQSLCDKCVTQTQNKCKNCDDDITKSCRIQCDYCYDFFCLGCINITNIGPICYDCEEECD